MSELNINWKTIRVGQVANGCIIDFEGDLRIAPLNGLARELALMIGGEDAAGDDDPAALPQEAPAEAKKKRRTRAPIEVTPELLDAISAKAESFTTKDLSSWFPDFFSSYKRVNSWLKKAVEDGKIEQGPRGKDGNIYMVVLGDPLMVEDGEPEDTPQDDGDEPELAQEEPEIDEVIDDKSTIDDTDLPF